MSFGLTLRLLRIDAGLSLRALAREVGVSSAYLSRVENGHDPAPTPERLSAIAGAIDVSPDMLMELAHQTSAALSAYIERVPAASAFFLEVARRGLDARQIARLRDVMTAEFAAPRPEPERSATISGLIGNRVILGLRCASIDDVITAGTACCVAGSELSADDVSRRIRQRERAAATVLGKGVVVPHAVVEGAPTTVSLITVAGGLPLEGAAGAPILAAFVLVSSRAGRPHLEILARLARLARHGIAGELAAVSSPEEAIRVIERLESTGHRPRRQN